MNSIENKIGNIQIIDQLFQKYKIVIIRTHSISRSHLGKFLFKSVCFQISICQSELQPEIDKKIKLNKIAVHTKLGSLKDLQSIFWNMNRDDLKILYDAFEFIPLTMLNLFFEYKLAQDLQKTFKLIKIKVPRAKDIIISFGGIHFELDRANLVMLSDYLKSNDNLIPALCDSKLDLFDQNSIKIVLFENKIKKQDFVDEIFSFCQALAYQPSNSVAVSIKSLNFI